VNGLLHRVAARAAGTAVAVRSDAGLPFAGGGSGQSDIGEAEAHFPTGPPPLAQMWSASAAHKRDRTTRPVDPTDPPAVANAARTPPSLVDARTDAAAVRDTPTIAPNATIAPRVESTQASDFDEPQFTMPPLHAEPLMPPPTLAAIEPEAEVALAAREIATPARTAMRADDPAPLMPREAGPAPLAPVAQPSARRGGSPQNIASTQSEDNTEVHIHIGRIDVTAVHEAPSPRRRTAAAPAPMSLDGYLAQRGRS
jgi:hypothetical protein